MHARMALIRDLFGLEVETRRAGFGGRGTRPRFAAPAPPAAALIRVGTRGSALALAQAEWVGSRLGEEYELVRIEAAGPVGDKSRWVSELERALLADEIDVAVHSAKDVPAELADGLGARRIPAREDPRDAICGASSLSALAPGARVGTSSLRRAAQIRASVTDLEVVELRGNVDTRLRKLASGECDALVLAVAGLARLGRMDAVDGVLESSFRPPARARSRSRRVRGGRGFAGCGCGGHGVRDCAERALTRALGASCNTPVGAMAGSLDGGEIELTGWVGRADGSAWVRTCCCGPAAGAGAARVGASGCWRRGAAELLVVTVYLVGAGPGDPGLLTRAGARADRRGRRDRLRPADPRGALDGARPDAELIYAGKEGGGPSMPQDEIDALLVEHGRRAGAVVRLKGGDPFVFGRGGEEARGAARGRDRVRGRARA